MRSQSLDELEGLEWNKAVMADLNPKSALAEGIKLGYKRGYKEARLEESKRFLTLLAEKKGGIL